MKLEVAGRAAYAYTGGKPFDPALPCLVLVHGALNDHSVWNLLARWFAHHGRGVLAVDLPGHSASAGPALTSIEAMADWLLALLDAAGVERAALAGHSMGSLVALEAAARAPARATRLAMLGSTYPMKVAPALLQTALEAPLEAIDRVVSYSHSTLAPKPSFPGPGIWLRGSARALGRHVLVAQGDAALFHTDFAACNAYAGAEAAGAKLACPAHLILGRFDQMTPARSAGALAALLRARVHTIDAGHSLMAEAPDAVLAAMRAALA
ncbi:MAG: alpha/beta hydrolase [Burkholderiales bacterium]|nr:alpha/beta hydrolase [Burkholderiales bacterium]MDE1928482.1 alpha/beta hydrolase [Burkholderiales bacterium]MDE2502848.1 alpha/beta hydrolase [Burkholderiales bacterium]